MTIKKYVLTAWFELVTTIIIDGKARIINFGGGSRAARTRGYLITDDEKLQQAIEMSTGFGVEYTLESTIENSVKKEIGTMQEKYDGNAVQETTVTSKNKAIAYIKDTFGEVFTSTISIEEMKSEALAKFNTAFVNWK